MNNKMNSAKLNSSFIENAAKLTEKNQKNFK